MAKSSFLEKAELPSDSMLADRLGPMLAEWQRYTNHIQSNYPAYTPDWKYYGRAWGWTLLFRSKKKTLAYLTPGDGRFVYSASMGAGGIEAARSAGLPDEVVEAVAASPANPAGKTFDLEVAGPGAWKAFTTLVALRDKY